MNIILNAATTQHRYKFTIYISGSFITVIYNGRYLERSDSGNYLVPLKNIVFRSLFFFFLLSEVCIEGFVTLLMGFYRIFSYNITNNP